MLDGNVKQDPIGNPIRGTNLVYNSYTGHADWRNCTNCGLCVGRRRTCVRRDGTHTFAGTIPSRILFIGEAPGVTENATGIPFTGTSGRILDLLFSFVRASFNYCITNLVCCQPMTIVQLYDKNGDPIDTFTDDEATTVLREPGVHFDAIDHNRQPTRKEMELCRPHITELLSSYRPQAVVYLGALARDNFHTQLPSISLTHPAAIARLEYKLLPIKRQARLLETFLLELQKDN